MRTPRPRPGRASASRRACSSSVRALILGQQRLLAQRPGAATSIAGYRPRAASSASSRTTVSALSASDSWTSVSRDDSRLHAAAAISVSDPLAGVRARSRTSAWRPRRPRSSVGRRSPPCARQPVGAGQPADRVEQQHDVLAPLREPLGAREHELGERHLLARRPVAGVGVTSTSEAVPLRHLLRAHVDEHHQHVRSSPPSSPPRSRAAGGSRRCPAARRPARAGRAPSGATSSTMRAANASPRGPSGAARALRRQVVEATGGRVARGTPLDRVTMRPWRSPGPRGTTRPATSSPRRSADGRTSARDTYGSSGERAGRRRAGTRSRRRPGRERRSAAHRSRLAPPARGSGSAPARLGSGSSTGAAAPRPPVGARAAPAAAAARRLLAGDRVDQLSRRSSR